MYAISFMPICNIYIVSFFIQWQCVQYHLCQLYLFLCNDNICNIIYTDPDEGETSWYGDMWWRCRRNHCLLRTGGAYLCIWYIIMIMTIIYVLLWWWCMWAEIHNMQPSISFSCINKFRSALWKMTIQHFLWFLVGKRPNLARTSTAPVLRWWWWWWWWWSLLPIKINRLSLYLDLYDGDNNDIGDGEGDNDGDGYE